MENVGQYITKYVKGKVPKLLFENPSYKTLPYLSPDYLRGKANPEFYAEPSDRIVEVDDGEVIVLWDGSNAGEIFISKRGILGSTMVKLEFDEEEIFKPYFSYSFQYLEYFLKAKTAGSGIPHADKGVIKKLDFFKPPKPEQTAIATLLSKVDEAIAATQNSIKAAEKLKKSLMQNLLTGKLKLDGSWRRDDEFYLDEKFGKVPKGWDVRKGKKIFKSYGSSSFDSVNLSNEGDCIYMKVSDFSLKGNELYINSANIMFSHEDNKGLKYCEPNFIVMSKRGEAIRKNRVRLLAKKTLLDPNLMALRIIDGCPLFFKFLLEQMNLQRFLENSALPQLNNKDFYPRFYLYPPVEEQEEMSNILLNQHNLICNKHSKIQTLERLKKSLMQNLLTGKVRLPKTFIAQFEKEIVSS